MDTIDEKRTNPKFIEILKIMKMDQRVIGLEKWLANNNWKFKREKEIKKVHFMGKLTEVAIRK
jgi:hypothetical protein